MIAILPGVPPVSNLQFIKAKRKTKEEPIAANERSEDVARNSGKMVQTRSKKLCLGACSDDIWLKTFGNNVKSQTGNFSQKVLGQKSAGKIAITKKNE